MMPPRALAFALLCAAGLAAVVTIRNDVPRVDQYGHIVNAHDGSVVHFEGSPFAGIYFMYGTVYENCTQFGTQCNKYPEPLCGYNPNTFALYTSPDLQAWTLVSTDVMPEMAKDNSRVDYWMPVVARNPTTSKFIMQYWSSHCGFVLPCAEIAVADSPFGPFTMVPPLNTTATPSSQMGFFADANGDAYVKYNTRGPQHHVVQKLAPDWLSTTNESAIVFMKPSFSWMEGGGMFKRGALYYYMTGTDCCFGTWGGDARYWTSYSPLGPWHPGVAPPPPTARCDLTGSWTMMGGWNPNWSKAPFTLAQAAGSDAFNFTDQSRRAAGSIDQATGYVTFPLLSASDDRGVVTSADGRAAGCDRIRWYGYENYTWCRAGAACTSPSILDAPEVNYCADGHMPLDGVRVNPCDKNVTGGMNFTVPAQQFNVIRVRVRGAAEEAVLYYGERANSAPDGLFSHNFQAWVNLEFDDAGAILPMTFPPSFQLDLVNATSGVGTP